MYIFASDLHTGAEELAPLLPFTLPLTLSSLPPPILLPFPFPNPFSSNFPPLSRRRLPPRAAQIVFQLFPFVTRAQEGFLPYVSSLSRFSPFKMHDARRAFAGFYFGSGENIALVNMTDFHSFFHSFFFSVFGLKDGGGGTISSALGPGKKHERRRLRQLFPFADKGRENFSPKT